MRNDFSPLMLRNMMEIILMVLSLFFIFSLCISRFKNQFFKIFYKLDIIEIVFTTIDLIILHTYSFIHFERTQDTLFAYLITRYLNK